MVFRHKDKGTRFSQLHELLVAAIEQNRGGGSDPSLVEFDAAAPTRTERMQAGQEKMRTQIQAGQEKKMTEMLGDERPDIVAAAAQMTWRFGGKRELKGLAGHLH